MKYVEDKFTVAMQGKKYRKGWSRIFWKKERKVPCGCVMGHGVYCQESGLCLKCAEAIGKPERYLYYYPKDMEDGQDGEGI